MIKSFEGKLEKMSEADGKCQILQQGLAGDFECAGCDS
jgi:hypothetical protein